MIDTLLFFYPLAGMAATIVSPLELFRTRLQIEMAEHRPGMKVVREIFHLTRQHGFMSLWRGLSPTLWRDVPFSGVYWMGYETLRPYAAHLCSWNGRESNEFIIAFASGATSGAVSGPLRSFLYSPPLPLCSFFPQHLRLSRSWPLF